MVTVVFDSHSFVKKLRAVGFTEEQAEVFAETQRDALSELVTREELERQLREMEYRLVIKIGVLLAGSATLFGLIIKLL